MLSRTGELYVGIAIEVAENLGNGKFNSELYELSVAPESFTTTSEGDEWVTFIEAIKFADVDCDGDIDFMLTNNGDPKLPAGSYLRNNCSMQFTFVKAAKSSNIQRLPQSAFKK